MTATKNTFKEIGFLANEAVTNQSAQELTSSECYKICLNLNRLAQSILNHAVIHTDDQKEVYAIVYFERMLSHYQAILLLTERGMLHQAEIMLRSLLEALFSLVAFYRHNDFFDVFVLGDQNQKLTFLKQIREKQRILDTYTDDELEELDRIIASTDNIDRADFTVFMKADLAGMLNEYRTLYPLLSESVHSTIHSLAKDLIINPKNKEIDDINVWNKKPEDIYPLLLSTANYMSIGLNMILHLVPNAKSEADLQIIENKIQGEWQHCVSAVSHR